MKTLRFAMFGAGFWSNFQLAAWQEVPGAQCVAIYNRSQAKAEAVARKFGVPRVYDDAEQLLRQEQLDFVDIVTDVGTHSRFVHLAAKFRIPAICQKPLASSVAEAEAMVRTCRVARVPLLVHENWRWQRPLRELKKVLDARAIGAPFRARIEMVSGFPVFANQPFLADLEQFILTDLGSHILDAARFLFGDAQSIYCQTHRTLPDIRGENVATVVMAMNEGRTSVVCNLAYAQNALERECFPETLVFVEGDSGSVEIAPGCDLRVTTKDGTTSRQVAPPHFAWADPAYAIVHASMVPLLKNLFDHLLGAGTAETTADDNLRTLRHVFASYDSARENRVLQLS